MKKFALACALALLPAVASATSVSMTAPYPGTTVNAGTRVSFTVLPSGFNHPTYQVVDSFGGGVSNVNIDSLGNFFWTPNISDVGVHTITISVSDTSGASANTAVSVTVNKGPTASASTVDPFVTAGSPVTFSVVTTGLTNPTYTVADSFSPSSLPSTAMGQDGSFRWTPVGQDVGVHTITVTASDSMGYTATTSQTITVLAPTTLTIIKLSPGYTVHVGELLTFTATTTGFVAPTFTVTDDFSTSTTATIDAAGNFSWTPQSSDIGGHPFALVVSDRVRTLNARFVVTVPPAPAGTPAAPVQKVSPSTASVGTPASHPSAAAYTFTKFLSVGSTGTDVTALQNILIAQGYLKVGATSYFGALTKAALMRYQSTHSLSPVGYVGPGTRAALNSGK
ncbi:MAG: peptidoglycan-binding protein [Patescibacteria group bacterium]|nr:peptidoglycan-binding protein [Patescibacteria group bacterium]